MGLRGMLCGARVVHARAACPDASGALCAAAHHRATPALLVTPCALTRCAARTQPWAADGKALEAAGAAAAADAPADFGSPARRGADEAAAAGDAPALARELADVKKRFVAVAKRKQQEYSKRARRSPRHAPAGMGSYHPSSALRG
jgi:hypothetical protein